MERKNDAGLILCRKKDALFERGREKDEKKEVRKKVDWSVSVHLDPKGVVTISIGKMNGQYVVVAGAARCLS